MKVFLFLSCVCCSYFVSARDNAAKVIIDEMLSACENVQQAKFTLYTEEKLRDGKFMITERLIKFKTKPRKIYFYSIIPDPGMEVLWKEGWNKEKMLISPSGFPYITFSLDPNSSLARKDSHHPIDHIGFDYLSGMLKYYMDLFKDRFYDFASVKDTVAWENHNCLVVEFDFNDYKIYPYRIKEKEDISTIAHRYRLNDYSILMINPFITDFSDVEAGQSVNIPNFYNRRFTFYIDRVNHLPLRQLIYDENGLYEKYEFRNFRLNPFIDEKEFDEKFNGYGF